MSKTPLTDFTDALEDSEEQKHLIMLVSGL